MDAIGPVDYALIVFPGNQFRGEIAPAIADLVENGTVRVIDIAFVTKDEAGEIAALEITDLDPAVREGLTAAGVHDGGLFSDEDLMSAAADLEPNTSAALLVWENVWAARVAQTIRNAGGVMVAFDRIPHVVVQEARQWALEQTQA